MEVAIKEIKKGQIYRYEEDPNRKYQVDVTQLSCSCGDNLPDDHCIHLEKVFEKLGISTRPGIKTKGGYFLDETVSSLQKEIRRGNEYEAGYWALEMADSGYTRYLFNRLAIIAVEDIGLADPDAIAQVMACRDLYEHKATTGNKYIPTEAIGFLILSLCRAPKNRVADDFICYVMEMRAKGTKIEIPDYAIDQHTRRGKQLLAAQARSEGKPLKQVCEEEFYFRGAVVNELQVVPGEDWTRRYLELIGLSR